MNIEIINKINSKCAIGIYSKRGKYGGTYAHKDIAWERLEILSAIAKYQLDVLNNAEKIKLLGDKNES